MEKIDFVIFIIIYIMVIGLVSSFMNPDMYSFGEEDYLIGEQFAEDKTQDSDDWWQGLVNFVVGTINAIATIAMFLWSGFTLNIPGIPLVIKALLCSPIYGGLAYLIATYMRGGG